MISKFHSTSKIYHLDFKYAPREDKEKQGKKGLKVSNFLVSTLG